MRILMLIKSPPEKFNVAIKDGSAGEKMKRILESMKPEAVYFTEIDGQRATVAIVDIDDAAKLPALAEPWFLSFNSSVQFHPVMSPEDLGRAGLEALGKAWA